MEELLREAFKLGQQWVKDINDEKEPESFTDWFNKRKEAIDETALIKHELELLSLPDVVDTEGECCESGCGWKHSHTNWWQCTVCKDIQAR